jgi:hypothetical protein
MRTLVVAAAVATVAAGLTGGAAAHAAPVTTHCAYAATAHAAVTGSPESFAGVAYGAAAFDDLGPHTLRCYVTVNGAEQSPGTLTGAGNAAVVTAGPVAYHAAATDTVRLCAGVDETFASHTTVCDPVTVTQVPPQSLLDAVARIWDVWDSVDPIQLDPIDCPVFASLSPGVPGVVDITPEGDVTVAGTPFWDCPPYGNLFPPDGPPQQSPVLRLHTLLP